MTESDAQPPTSQSPLRRTQPLILFREDSIADAVTKTLEYDPANPLGVFDIVKDYGASSFGFAGSATLRLFAASKPGSERVPISNDAQLRDVLSGTDENTQLEVYVGLEQAAPIRQLRITAECHPDTSTFDFPFSLTDTNVKARLFHAAVEAIQKVNSSYAAPAEVEELEVAVAGEKTKIRSDKVLLEVLNHELGADASAAPLTVILPGGLDASRSRGSPSTVVVDATYRAALSTSTANFKFSYQGDEGNLLESFRSECRGELELPAGCKITITATTADGPVPITGDSQLLALLSAAGGQVLRVELADAESASAAISIETNCTLVDGEACSFAFKARIDEANLLGSLRAAVINSLDLDDGDLSLTYVDAETKEPVVLSSDRQLRDIIAHHHEVGAPMDLHVQAKKRQEVAAVPLKTFHITHGDTHATFTNYKCPQGPGELLRSLVHDIRWEFELLRRSGSSEAPVSLTLEAKLAGGSISVAEDDPENLFAQVASAPDADVNITVTSSEAPPPAVQHTHWLRSNVHVKIGDGREYATFVFRCSSGQPDLLKEFVKELAGELELEGDDEPTILVFDGAVDPPVLIEKDEALFALASTEQFHQPHRFVAEIDLPYRAPASPHARSASRMAELNALTAEWKDALEGLWRPSNIEQMAATFAMEGTALPSDDALMVHLREALKDDTPRSVEDLHDTLLEWTSHFGEELFSAFCHHCREVLDFVVDFSPISRLKRAIGVAFRQMSVNLRVGKAELAQVLHDSKAIAEDDINECLTAYGETLSSEEFTEALTWLFRDAPQDIVDVITVLQQGANRSPARARREVELLRRKRLQSEIRHAFDSVSVFHMKDFASANQATDEQDWLNLAQAVALLLNDDVARTKQDPAQASWKWLIGQIDEEKKALNFLSHLGQTQRSYASLGDISLAVTFLLAPGAEAGALLPASKLLSSLSMWGLRLAQLTCHAQRWTWPPPGAFTHASPPPSHHLGSPIKVAPPAEDRSTALVTARPRRYEFKHRGISTEYAAMEIEPPKQTSPTKSLKELMEEQRQQRENGGAETPADVNANGEPEQNGEPKQIEDTPKADEPQAKEDPQPEPQAKEDPKPEPQAKEDPQPEPQAKEDPQPEPQAKEDPKPEPQAKDDSEGQKAPTPEERRRSSAEPATTTATQAEQQSQADQSPPESSATNGQPAEEERPALSSPRSQEQETAAVQLQLAGRQKLARDEVEERKRTRSQPPAE